MDSCRGLVLPGAMRYADHWCGAVFSSADLAGNAASDVVQVLTVCSAFRAWLVWWPRVELTAWMRILGLDLSVGSEKVSGCAPAVIVMVAYTHMDVLQRARVDRFSHDLAQVR